LIKAIFFDYDGVLTTDRTGSITTVRFLSKAADIDLNALRQAFAEYNLDLTLGKTTHELIWPSVCGAVGQKIDFTLLQGAFESTPMNIGVFDLAQELRRHYHVGIITDNKADRIRHLREFQRLDDRFNPIIVSAEIGASKSQPEIFLHALAQLGIEPNEGIFVDNNLDNLLVPDALGMKTIFHDDEKNDLVALRSNIYNALQDSAGVA
jgi:HAD superfamily hydrolase (TIGR01509 family)